MEQDKDFKLSDDRKELIKYEGECANVIIPEGVEVVKWRAFEKNDCIKKVVLPSTINKLCDKAFMECPELEDVEFHVIPEDFRGCSFCNCKKLNKTIIHNSSLIRVPISTNGKYIIPEEIEKVSKGAFCDCVNITEIVIPQGVKYIEELAFNGLLNLKSITISASVESIAERAFIDCGKVENIIVDKSNPKFDSRDNCNAIVDTESNRIIFGCSKTVFVNTITSIGEYAFAYCTDLKELILPNTITEIQSAAFEKCNNLKVVELPSSLKSIESYVFSGCKKLEKIILNEGIENIDYSAFEECDNVTTINIPNTFVPNEDYGWIGFIEVFKSVKTPLYNKDLFISLPQSYSGGYVIPDGITKIIGCAFYECKELTEVTFPDTLTEVSAFAFSGCSKLNTIIGSKAVSVIRENAFEECTELSSIELLNTESIENKAFYRCTKLSDVALNDEVTIIGNPFRGCPDINIHTFKNTIYSPIVPEDGNIILPSTLKKLAPGAFESCTVLKSIIIPHEIEIGAEAFKDCINLQSVILSDEQTILPMGIFQGCKSLKQVDLPQKLEIIESSAFKNCESLENIKLPNGVSKLEEESFSGCISLSQVNWEDIDSSELVEIGHGAFERCQSLTGIAIPYKVLEIKDRAFFGCQALQEIDFFGDSLSELGYSVFEGCSSLESIVIPYGLKRIKADTFKDCKSLRYVKVPHSVNKINNSAFEGCNNIETADMSDGWNSKREAMGLPPAHPSRMDYFDDDDDEPLTGLGATEDGPMICTEGRMWPCPYCGSNDVQTYIDGTAQCHDCRRWYKYTQSWF